MTSGEKLPSPKTGAHFDLPPPALKISLGKKTCLSVSREKPIASDVNLFEL